MNSNIINMSKHFMTVWANAGKHMSAFMEERFNSAIMRDMMTTDEEGMFFLFCFEQGMAGFNDVMKYIMFEEMMVELSNLMGR